MVRLHRHRFHGFETFHPAHGQSRDVEIHLVGGAPHIRTFDVDGNQILNRLVLRRISRRDNKRDGSVRLSAEYGVVDRDGQADGYLRLRLDQTAADGLKGYNRPEHLRAFPEDSNVFVEVQRPLRGSAESANRSIDDNPAPRTPPPLRVREEPAEHARLADLPQRSDRGDIRSRVGRRRRGAAAAESG